MNNRSHLDFFDKRSVNYLTDWLIDGFISYYVYDQLDGFYPHSSFGVTGDPLFAIREAYVNLTSKSQSKLRRAIEGLLVIATPGSSIRCGGDMTVQMRLNLLSIISILMAETGGLEASSRLANLGTIELEGWGGKGSQREAYTLVLRGLVAIASGARMHSSFNRVSASAIEASLVRMICSPLFESRFVARSAYALMEVGEESFFRNYETLLRDHFLKLHEADSAEQDHAHLTADLIVDRLPKQLMGFASRMEVSGERPRDVWMLNAWDSPRSKFFLHRPDRNAARLALARRHQHADCSVRSPAISIENSNFFRYQVRSALDQGIPAVRGIIDSAGLRNISSILKPPTDSRPGVQNAY